MVIQEKSADTEFLEEMLQKAKESKIDALLSLNDALQENKELSEKLYAQNVKYNRLIKSTKVTGRG